MGEDPLLSYREATRVHQPHGWKKHVTRRKVIAGGVAAGGVVWSAPAVYAWATPNPPGSNPCDHHIKYLCVVFIWSKYQWARFGCIWDTEKNTWVAPTQTTVWSQPFCLPLSWGWTKCTSTLVDWMNKTCKVDKVGDGPDAEYQLTMSGTSGLAVSEGWSHNGDDKNHTSHCNPCYRYGTGWRFKPYIIDVCATTTTYKPTTTTSKATTTTSKATTTTQKATTTTYKATTTTHHYGTTTTTKPTTTTTKKATTTTYRHW